MKGRTGEKLQNVPSHLALIPDGNRRWSNSHRLTVLKGYQRGVDKFINFGIWAKGFGVNTLTVWALSTENVKNRGRSEINIIYRLLVHWASDPKLLETLRVNGANVKIIGDLSLLPKRVKSALLSLQRKTNTYKEFTINILVGYGGKDDLMHAFKSLYNDALNGKSERITPALIAQKMRTAALPEVDYIIRTSGEERLSGFLPWQSDYSELYFAKKYWPDFEKKDLEKALRVFSERQRRFGR
ncbi:MAG: polyprenyl diphosphate synthase [Candidatus Micrarchaeaceae archaeon]|nr:di-trans,poly-cis-decaprenylcistransferase [Candidatus Micrarchaeota archaeon]HII10050.1 di-trans,poly-cis-decaprenylcistransferase [Candidatus Micrarchaeota archaeon]